MTRVRGRGLDGGVAGVFARFQQAGFARKLATKLEERGIRRGKSKGAITYEPEGMKLLMGAHIGGRRHFLIFRQEFGLA